MNGLLLRFVILGLVGSEAYQIEQSIPNAHTYQEQQDDGNAFKYGYRVQNINNQFQHKQKGPDDVTYGCYGHVDPDGRKQLTYFVADRFGYRVVLTGQPTTVYPLSPAQSAVSGGVSDGRQMTWNELPFPVACQSDSPSFSSSSAGAFRRNPPSPGSFDEAFGAESRDSLQRTLLEENRNTANANEPVHIVQPFDGQRPPATHPTMVNLGAHQPDEWMAGSVNNNAVINAPASSNAANKGQTAGQSRPPSFGSWRPFLGASNSFLLSSQCEKPATLGHPGAQTLTLYIPFRILCSDMPEFEAEAAKLVAQFNHDEC